MMISTEPHDSLAILHELAISCLHCGLCLPACPTYAELGTESDSPRGRIYLLRALLEQRVSSPASVIAPLDRCLGCRACETACPSGVHYGQLLELARARLTEPARPVSMRSLWWRWLIRQVLPHRARFRLLIALLRLLSRSDREWMPAFLRQQIELLPPYYPAPRPVSYLPARGVCRGRAGFLSGCVMPNLYPRSNFASMQLLAEAGYEVVAPANAGCCGALQAHDGDADGAKAAALRTMAAFGDCNVVVASAAGCGAAMKAYPGEFAGRVRDLSEALLAANWQPPAQRQIERELRVVYHDPCHLAHGQGIRQAPRELLGRLGVKLVATKGAEYCCGGAGTYALLQPTLAQALMERRVDHLLAADPDLVITANPSCLMQLSYGLRKHQRALPVLHLAEILFYGYSWPKSAMASPKL
ncbi:MAG: 4Fe-4S dicluster domain-containing protein [Cyanobacteria bacterium NC_groundwater_1444_Ag_S-0.65um_54_12]|nr:4Fe-4S dicluster domain-containing protein [Cyanobacteria bacterium NC_groundwater_1444_Ag_S-0.65um_54_12]